MRATIPLLALFSSFLHLTQNDDYRLLVKTYNTLTEVRVLGSQNRPVPNLKVGDFRVKLGGREAPILFFQEEREVAVSVAMLVDRGSSMSSNDIAAAKDLIFQLVHRLSPQDEILLGVYEKKVAFLSPLTTNRYALVEGIENISTGGRTGFFEKLAGAFGSSGFTGSAVDESLLRLTSARNPVKAVLVISAAFGNIGRATGDHLAEAGARLFAVTAENKVGDALNLWGDKMAYGRILKSTGGVAYEVDWVVEHVDTLRDALKNHYLLAYEFPDGSDGTEKLQIEIRDRPEWTVRFAPRTAGGNSVYRN